MPGWILSKAVEKLGLEWSPPEEPSRSRLDEWFLPGRRQAPQQQHSPFFPEVHDELTRSWRSPYSARLCTSASSALTTIDGAEAKGYERMPQLDESVAAHLCPPTAIGWKAKATHPSKPCRTTSALAGRSDESCDSARTRSGHSETRGHLQERHHSPTQSVSENAGPHGRSIACFACGLSNAGLNHGFHPTHGVTDACTSG